MAGDPNEIIVTEFYATKTTITNKMKVHPIFKDYKDGQTVYLNTIFTVYGPTANNGKRYDQNRNGGGKSGIYDAESWACKSSTVVPCTFRYSYDVAIEFKGSYPIYVQYLNETTRTSVKAQTEIESTYGKPEYEEEGKWPAWNYTKAKTIDGK